MLHNLANFHIGTSILTSFAGGHGGTAPTARMPWMEGKPVLPLQGELEWVISNLKDNSVPEA